MKTNFLHELTWRGMVHNHTPEVEKLLQQPTTAYVGFDPTADSLHIGNLVSLMLLVYLQRAGHTPIALIGGATGMIGDPSGKSKERNLLDEDTIRYNLERIKLQMQKFLDFETTENPAEIVNNYDWYKNFNVIDFLRNVGKHLTISYMIAKDSVQNRLETGISFTEFSYQLLQGYDFYWLYTHKNCRLQMGGSDQWGNITAGIELISKLIPQAQAHAITCPLLTKSDGSKFGKSEQGNIWLDANKTSPYKFYQFWLNVDDKDLPKLLRIFLPFDQATIKQLETDNAQNPNALKRILAKEITTMVHSVEDYQKAEQASQLLYGKAVLEQFEATDLATLQEVFEGLPRQTYTAKEFESIATTTDLVALALQISKSEANRLIKGNGVSINKTKLTIEQATQKPNFTLLKEQFLLIQKGKQYFLVEVLK
ncbi:MAG: tyrosine--tRNA ligase [Microscillaceae bacterium]|nr:tyrosine--tRNA ligase [Microscillaceae bacterium]MDW8461099.1 tyrosine--tRNA ligase [Cytophagales bacterium]